MHHELLPDVLVRLWDDVEKKLISYDDFRAEQDRLVGEYGEIWKKALLLGSEDLQESILRELSSCLGCGDIEKTRRICLHAVRELKGEWQQKVENVDQDSVKCFYDQSLNMVYELMWWHTLAEDNSPLAYVAALEFAGMRGCRQYLDFGSGVGSGGILFARNGFSVTLADISSTSLKFCSWRFAQRRLFAECLDLKEKKLPDNAYDFITAMDVFEHLVDPVGTVRDLQKALKKGGFLFGRFAAEKDEDRPHHIVLDFGPTRKALEESGFVRVWQDKWLWGHEVFQKL
ncbi:MAG: class I SAM-dependent methyltransferase [Desulfobacteraceae bacterium]|nr:class I SAM-dependent methyltransferase [Desulfobacteraceae bacterium]